MAEEGVGPKCDLTGLRRGPCSFRRRRVVHTDTRLWQPDGVGDSPRWWDMRPAQGNQARRYTCPFCHGALLAMTPNTLLFPEGDHERRRHAHTDCVMAQRKAGKLLTRKEWEATHRPAGVEQRPPWWRRLFGDRSAD